MRFIRNFLVLSLMLLGVTAAGVSAQTPTTPLERKVFKEISTLPNYGVFDHIAFQVEGSTVTLFGRVWDGRNRSQAERFVKKLPGVTSVDNRIEILPASGFDNAIRRELVRTLVRNGALGRYLMEPRPEMRLIVENGRVTLEGYVSTRGDYNLANILANGVPGVFEVKNNLIIGKEAFR